MEETALKRKAAAMHASDAVAHVNDEDSFTMSMTFARFSEHRGGCDCDDCDYYYDRLTKSSAVHTNTLETSTTELSKARPMGRSMIPKTIEYAIDQYKRQRPLPLLQSRTLLTRHDAVSVWEWNLPTGAEPLVEFGVNHRIVWIQRCPGRLQTIGKGVVGSSDEQQGRTDLDFWTAGSVIFVPSNEGQAVGYVHVNHTMDHIDFSEDAIKSQSNEITAVCNENSRIEIEMNTSFPLPTPHHEITDDDDTARKGESISTDRYSTMIMVKIPQNLLLQPLIDDSSLDRTSFIDRRELPHWLDPLVALCRRLMAQLQSKTVSNLQHPVGPQGILLPSQDAKIIKAALLSSC